MNINGIKIINIINLHICMQPLISSCNFINMIYIINIIKSYQHYITTLVIVEQENIKAIIDTIHIINFVNITNILSISSSQLLSSIPRSQVWIQIAMDINAIVDVALQDFHTNLSQIQQYNEQEMRYILVNMTNITSLSSNTIVMPLACNPHTHEQTKQRHKQINQAQWHSNERTNKQTFIHAATRLCRILTI